MKNRFARLSRALQGRQGVNPPRPTWQRTRQPGRLDSDHPRSPQGEPTNRPECVIQARRPLGLAAQRKHRVTPPTLPRGSALRSQAAPPIPPPLRHGARKALLVPRRLIGLAAPQAAYRSGSLIVRLRRQPPPGCSQTTLPTGRPLSARRSALRNGPRYQRCAPCHAPRSAVPPLVAAPPTPVRARPAPGSALWLYHVVPTFLTRG